MYQSHRLFICSYCVVRADKQIYTHLTCATDTEAMKVVFHSVQDIIIRKSLEDAGLLG